MLIKEGFYRDANHSIFCIIIQIFKADFCIMISDVIILANNDFKMVPDKIKKVTSTCTPIWKNYYLGAHHSGKSAMIRESNHGSSVCKEPYA